MSYIKHTAVIVTGSEESLKLARRRAVKEYKAVDGANLIGKLMVGMINGHCSFAIVPDGGKEGSTRSNDSDSARKNFLNWLLDKNKEGFKDKENYFHCDFVEVSFGGWAEDTKIESTSH